MSVRNDPHAVLYSIAFLEYLASSMLLPVAPYYALGLGATTAQIALLGTSFALTQLAFGTLLGRLSDHLGRRWVLQLGLLGSLTGFVVFAVAPSLAWLYVARLISGGFTVTLAMVQASVAATDRTRSMLGIGIACNVGEIVGPLVGGGLDAIGVAVGWGHRFAIWGSAALAAANLLLARRRFHPEQPRKPGATAPTAPHRERWNLSIWPLFAAAFATMFAVSGFEWTTPLVTVERLDWNEALGGVAKNGYLLALFGVTRAGAQTWLRARSLAWQRERWGVVFALVTLALGFAVLAGTTNVPALVAATVLIGVGAGLGAPLTASLISQAAPPEKRGQAFGALQSVSAMGSVVGPASIGTGFQTVGSGYALTASAAGLLTLALLPLWSLVCRTRQRAADPASSRDART